MSNYFPPRYLAVFMIFVGTFLPTMLVSGQTTDETPSPVAAVNPDSTPTATEPKVDLEFLFNGENPTSLEQLREMQDRVREVYQKIKPATVNIRMQEAQGTGVIVSKDGYILTAAHVIGDPGQEAIITFPDGRTVKAKTLGINARFDSGMLRINDKDESFPYLDLGVSEDLVKGQWVIAIGHPGGLDKDRGLVLRVGRLLSTSHEVLQTDCVLVGGDSGGPLVDMNGDLIGIHSRIGIELWLNMHVPIDVFLDQWDQLADGENIGRKQVAYLGFSLEGNTNEISMIDSDSPADKAGLKTKDKIIRFIGSEVTTKKEIASAFDKVAIGDEIEITIVRDEQEKIIKLTVGKTYK